MQPAKAFILCVNEDIMQHASGTCCVEVYGCNFMSPASSGARCGIDVPSRRFWCQIRTARFKINVRRANTRLIGIHASKREYGVILPCQLNNTSLEEVVALGRAMNALHLTRMCGDAIAAKPVTFFKENVFHVTFRSKCSKPISPNSIS